MSQRPPLRLMRRAPGMTLQELATRAGVDISTAKRWSSIPRDEWLIPAQEKRERVYQLCLQGLTMREIADEMDCSLALVYRYAKEARDQGKLPPLKRKTEITKSS